MLRYSTSGESHGICLIAVLEGMVAGLKLDPAAIDHDLWRRQQGYGRGGRMLIETDRAELLTGIRQNETIGGPLAMRIENKDFKINQLPVVHRPRPGHADLVGAMKFNRRDVRDILERASARETTARVAVGAVCRQFLAQFGVKITSHVTDIGGVKVEDPSAFTYDQVAEHAEEILPDEMRQHAAKDTVGGVFEIRVKGLPPGLGSFTTSDARLDARLAFALMSIQAVKGVEFGLGFAVAHTSGSKAHDEIFYNEKTKKFFRKTNRAGGLEGSMTTGEELVIRAAAKPYATLMKPLASTNIQTKAAEVGTIERSDVTAVPACGVVGESMAMFELAKVFLEKFGGDSLSETRRNFDGYLKQVEEF